ncbi:MAG TPA: TRAP transporter substrate-binding protein [Ferrovibrio sp.]|jgi:TRAP-type mannitol/chloroaromatic compound transport system substrate-binding protein|uniref:TRAP transporter substrate-binding protein n=1 Tax=Ferrovibrio sp. TaxID=1917215 RepID=UPI002B4B2111|nr:TRAP transporter substrate-binding protein [Ferrovibrio sp.]HLT78271.1 TRAP transporter substrate-binding protein [Ferrovibrio sp.]
MKTNITKTEGAVKQSRRKFLKAGGLAAAAAAGTVAMPNVSRAQTVTLKLQSSWVAADPFSDMAQQYVQRVNEMAGNRLKIDYLLGGAVVHPFSVQDAVHNGVIDATHTVPVYWYGKHKAASLFGTGPVFGFNAEQGLGWIYYGGGKELYKELIDDILKLNIVSFFSMPMPTQPLGWFKKPVRSAADMKGLKYRTVGLAADLMQVMGAAVAQIPGGEIVPAMERGVIDAFEYNNPTADRRFGAQNVAKNYMLGSYHQATEYFEIMFNKQKFNSLPKEHQAILQYAAEAASSSNYWYAMDLYSKDLQELKEKDKVNVLRTPKDVFEAQIKAWDVLIEQLGKDPYMKKVMESQKAWAKRVVYYETMNAADYVTAYEHHFGKMEG